MRYRLELKLKRAEGALIRVLGMTERRGYPPHAVKAQGGRVFGLGRVNRADAQVVRAVNFGEPGLFFSLHGYADYKAGRA